MLPLLLASALPLLAAGKATINDQIAALETANSPLLQFPTQLTQNIVPKPIHSHNDCRSVRLLHPLALTDCALQTGATSRCSRR